MPTNLEPSEILATLLVVSFIAFAGICYGRLYEQAQHNWQEMKECVSLDYRFCNTSTK